MAAREKLTYNGVIMLVVNVHYMYLEIYFPHA